MKAFKFFINVINTVHDINYSGGSLSLGDAMAGLAADINLWDYAMTEQELTDVNGLSLQGNVINMETLKTAGLISFTSVTAARRTLYSGEYS